jgi:undecaprenyl-diphosphatase
MLDQLIELDKKLLVFLNSLHTSWLDPVMLYLTQTYVWIPMYVLLMLLILKDFRSNSWAVFIGIAITILLANEITSSFMKPYFARPRPTHEPSLEGLVHIVSGYVGGQFGFASSHAANTFGTATFFWLVYRNTRKWMMALFIWAAVMTYTRIYLGVHYPGDILAGITVGILSAFLGFKIHQRLFTFSQKRLSRPGDVQ